MCLGLQDKNGKPLIATKDICCYKWVEPHYVSDIDELIYQTPYRYAVVRIGSTYTSIFSFSNDGWSIEKGLHSFTNKRSLEVFMRSRKLSGSIVRCCIPKGSKYYKGRYSKYNGLASDMLTYVEIIKEIS